MARNMHEKRLQKRNEEDWVIYSIFSVVCYYRLKGSKEKGGKYI